jgi:rhodanese-related sulfurtransferase
MASEGEKVGVEEARREIAGGDATAVDVRSEEEWSEGHVPGAIHLPDGDPEAATKRSQSKAGWTTGSPRTSPSSRRRTPMRRPSSA